jgi:hypothetical protein
MTAATWVFSMGSETRIALRLFGATRDIVAVQCESLVSVVGVRSQSLEPETRCWRGARSDAAESLVCR